MLRQLEANYPNIPTKERQALWEIRVAPEVLPVVLSEKGGSREY